MSVEVTGKRGTAVFYPEKRYMRLNGVKVAALFAPFKSRGRYYVSDADWVTVLLPFFHVQKKSTHPVLTVTIDPGHGGKDPGTSANGIVEKTLTLRFARRLAARLRADGYKVVLTRTGDNYVELGRRASIANAAHSDLFISVHVNSAGNRGVSGLESFCLTPAGAASTSGAPDKISTAVYPGNARNGDNFMLAYCLQKAMLKCTRADDMGVKFARFKVLQGLKCPGALLEIGFASNASDAKKLRSDAYLDLLINGIEQGIINYRKAGQ